MRILYITRKFPPSVGGMEIAAYELYEELNKKHNVDLVMWGGSNKWLPVVFPYLFIKSLVKMLKSRPDLIYLQDGILSPMIVLSVLFKIPSVMTIHGLEVTYKNPVYKILIWPFLKLSKNVVCVSNNTMSEAKKLITSKRARFTVIPNGLTDKFNKDFKSKDLYMQLDDECGIDKRSIEGKKIVLTTGRLVERKGVRWFVENVAANLTKDAVYLVAGGGPEKGAIKKAIISNNLAKKVFLLNRVSDSLLESLYNAADVFVMPNLPVEGDVEGFGLVALEASSCGAVVVAANIDGIADAVHDGENGVLLMTKDAESFSHVLNRELKKPSISRQQVRRYVLNNFSWSSVANQYMELFKKIANHSEKNKL